MNPAQLLSHFDRISDAPDAIPRLRRLILDLAVRGKLEEQNNKDEPASALLKRIVTEKIRRGRIERVKRVESTSLDDEPFPLPLGWTWASLADLVAVLNGRAYSQNEFLNSGTPVLRVGNLFTSKHWYYSNLELEEDKYCSDGDLIFAWSASFGPFIWHGPKVIYHYHIWKLDLHNNHDLNKHYLYRFLLKKTQEIKESGHGISMIHMTKEKMEKLKVPLPPLAEQHRIVAKVDELMALCDRLEAVQAERESWRDRLVASSLNRLSNGVDANAFHDRARFYFNHLPHLTTKGEHIQQLRQTIFNLAVRGKLVPQDPNDEPASELLNRIRAEKEVLVKGCKVKPSMPLLDLAEETMPFHLPPNWRWVRFGELIIEADAGWSPKSEGFPRTADNWGVLKVSAVSWDKFYPEENKQLLPGVIPPKAVQVRAGDFLISRANTSKLVAKCAVVGDVPRNLILSDKIVRLQITTDCNKKFLSIVNNHAEHARSYYAEEASGTSLSMKNVSRAVIYALVIPLPPLAEQQRIVAKVDELMALCDKLETQLTITQTESHRLLEALLHEALAPAM